VRETGGQIFVPAALADLQVTGSRSPRMDIVDDPALQASPTDAPVEAEMQSALDPAEAGVLRFPLADAVRSCRPPVRAAVIDPDVTVAQLLNHASGPLPLSVEVEVHGGTVLLFVSGTGRVSDFEPGYVYPLGVAVSVGGNHVGQATLLAMTPERHGFANLLVINGLEWGRHTLALESFKGVMTADETDLFNLTVIEI
jgi:hypothetical protein